MYKLVLCLRYLRRRAIAYFAVLGVALCVAMMLIVVSVMTGFVNKIERAARGLFGDIVFEPLSQAGIPHYDDLIRRIVEDVNRVEAASPRIYSYGVLRIPGQAGYGMLVQIAGIRLPEAVTVTDFEDGLFVQAGLGEPTFHPSPELMAERVSAHIEEVRAVAARERAARDDAKLPEATDELLKRLANAERYLRRGLDNIQRAEAKAEALEYLLAAQESLLVALKVVESARDDFRLLADGTEVGGDITFAGYWRLAMLIAELDERLVGMGASFDSYYVLWRARWTIGLAVANEDMDLLEKVIDQFEAETIEAWPHRVILGLGVGWLSFSTPKGEMMRIVGPGSKITLYVFPIGKQLSLTDVSPNVQRLTVVDDCSTDVRSIDSKTVYLPFAELQRLNDMAEQTYQDGRTGPARCSQIQIKVRSDVTSEAELQDICDEIDAVWRQFKRDYSESYPNDFPKSLTMTAEAQTWRERQIDTISTIETQRLLMIIMFGIMSMVSVVLVFVIFYMIVVQKTRDIGVLKAIGASSPGVAGIFLAYGAVIGLVGSIIGSVGGYFFVRNINAVQDWLDDVFDYRVWDPERFLFAKIPNEVDWLTMLIIILGAIAAGVLGAVVPAIRAARMQPVEALRYE